MASGQAGPTEFQADGGGAPAPQRIEGRRPVLLLFSGPAGAPAPALARAAGLLGAAERPGLVGPLLDEIVAALGRAWSDWAPVPEEWFASEAADDFARRLALLIAEGFAGEPLGVVEDARIARLIPLWRHALALAGYEPCFVLTVVAPNLAIAAQVRAGRSASSAALAWLRTVVDAERGARNGRRLILADPAVVTDWRRAMARTAAAFGFAWPLWTSQVEPVVDEAVAAVLPDLSAEAPAPDLDNISRWCERAFESLGVLAMQADAPKAAERLDDVAYRADRLADQITPLLGEKITELERAQARAVARLQRRHVRRVTDMGAQLEEALRRGASEPAPQSEPDSGLHEHNLRTADLQAEVDALRAASLDSGALLAARDRDIDDLRQALAFERRAAEALEDLEARHAEARQALEQAQADAQRWRGAAHRLADEVGAKVAVALETARRREEDALAALADARVEAAAAAAERDRLMTRLAALETDVTGLRQASDAAAEDAARLRDDLLHAADETAALRARLEAREAALRAWETRGFLRRLFGLRPRAGRAS